MKGLVQLTVFGVIGLHGHNAHIRVMAGNSHVNVFARTPQDTSREPHARVIYENCRTVVSRNARSTEFGVPGDLGHRVQNPVAVENRLSLEHVSTEVRAPALHMVNLVMVSR